MAFLKLRERREDLLGDKVKVKKEGKGVKCLANSACVSVGDEKPRVTEVRDEGLGVSTGPEIIAVKNKHTHLDPVV